MDARGYGRQADVPARTRRLSAALVLGGLTGLVISLYGLLDAGSPGLLGLPLALVGLVLAAAGFRLAGRRSIRTRYRPDPWRGPEWLTSISGAVPAAVLVVSSATAGAGLLVPPSPISWPTLPLVPALAVLIGLLPAWFTPLQEAPAPSPADDDSAPRHPDALPAPAPQPDGASAGVAA